MKLYIDCSIVESKKYVTKMQVFLDEHLIAESLLQEADFSVFHIEVNQERRLRVHFEPVRKKDNPLKPVETCSYEDFESLYSATLSQEAIEHMQEGHREEAHDNFICPITWTYAYDTVIENVSSTEQCLVFMFSDEFIHDDIQVADIIFPKEKQANVKLVKCISENELKTGILKKNIEHWVLYILMILIWIPLYYGLYSILTAPVRHLYVIQNGIFTLLPYIALPFSLFYIFLIWRFWKGTYRAIKEMDELVLTEDMRERIKSAKNGEHHGTE